MPDKELSNRYDRAAWAGAFGDLGTQLPFMLAYIAVVKIDPLGILLGLGFGFLLGWLVLVLLKRGWVRL